MIDALDQAYSPTEHAANTRVGGDIVILHLERGIYFGLDEVGTKIWDRIAEGQSMNDICSAIAEEYGVPREEVEQDARSFLKDLLEADLIAASATGAGS